MSKLFRPHPKMLRPLRTGPLGPHLESFAALLSQQGYVPDSGWKKLRLVATLSQWMVQKNLPIEKLNEQQIAVFLRRRRKSGEQCTLTLLLRHLREADVIPPPVAAALNPIDLLEREYGRFLRQERGFMPASVGQYLPVARRFLWRRFRDGKIRLHELRTKDVTDFILKDGSNRGRRSAQLMTSVLRSFLNYLFQEGRTASNLAMETGAHVRCTGKGRKSRCVPLRKEVVVTLRGWLRERNAQPLDPVFPNARGRPLSRDGVQYLLTKHVSAARQQCPSLKNKHVSPHVLRHSTAMDLLQSGADRSIIALWLGHERMDTTQIYLHASLELKEKALAKTEPFFGRPRRIVHPTNCWPSCRRSDYAESRK